MRKNSLITVVLLCFAFSNLYSLGSRITSSKAVIMVDSLNIRSESSITSKVVGKVNTGDIVEIVSSPENKDKIDYMKDYWYLIEKDGVKGYCFGYYMVKFDYGYIYNHHDLGIIVFLDDEYSFVKKMNYNSYNKVYRENNYSKNEEVKFECQYSSKLFDKFVLIENAISSSIPRDYGGEPIKYMIYNNSGVEIFKEDGYPPELVYFAKNDLLLFVYINVGISLPYYDNHLKIINSKGNILKDIRSNLEYREFNQYYSYSGTMRQFQYLLSEDYGKLFIFTNSMMLILDLNTLKEKYISFNKLINELNVKNDFDFNIDDAKEDGELIKIFIDKTKNEEVIESYKLIYDIENDSIKKE